MAQIVAELFKFRPAFRFLGAQHLFAAKISPGCRRLDVFAVEQTELAHFVFNLLKNLKVIFAIQIAGDAFEKTVNIHTGAVNNGGGGKQLGNIFYQRFLFVRPIRIICFHKQGGFRVGTGVLLDAGDKFGIAFIFTANQQIRIQCRNERRKTFCRADIRVEAFKQRPVAEATVRIEITAADGNVFDRFALVEFADAVQRIPLVMHQVADVQAILKRGSGRQQPFAFRLCHVVLPGAAPEQFAHYAVAFFRQGGKRTQENVFKRRNQSRRKCLGLCRFHIFFAVTALFRRQQRQYVQHTLKALFYPFVGKSVGKAPAFCVMVIFHQPAAGNDKSGVFKGFALFISGDIAFNARWKGIAGTVYGKVFRRGKNPRFFAPKLRRGIIDADKTVMRAVFGRLVGDEIRIGTASLRRDFLHFPRVVDNFPFIQAGYLIIGEVQRLVAADDLFQIAHERYIVPVHGQQVLLAARRKRSGIQSRHV